MGDGIFGNRADDEVYEGFPQRPIGHGIDPADGLPRPAIQHAVEMAYAPPLSLETLVCMEDASSFVVRDEWGHKGAEWLPENVKRTPNGAYRALWSQAKWVSEIMACAENDTWVLVEPVRPACKHYARQMTDFQDDPDHEFVARLCTARRTDGGEFLSLRDSQVYACELRTPSDTESAERLARFDAEKIRLGRERTAKPEVFDIEAALAAQQEEQER